jgi:ABC-type polysaccharide/polyol phosphate transport system ATPase subunit
VSSTALADTVPGAGTELPAIEVRSLSASYHIHLDNDRLLDDVRDVVLRRKNKGRLVPALRDLTFDVKPGSVLAIIGRNGAGKSTLLRAISGILTPEKGRIIVRGRTTLLAPGLGMSDDLTGRENILLGGLAAGLTKERLEVLTDEIAEFAQLGEYIDYPLRAYSMGMRMRVAAAVAAYLDPEILLIDEALAGGDAAFQAHIADKMAELTGQGRTMVLVTHGLSSVKTVATEAMWMHAGQIAAFGDPDEVVSKYMRYCRLESLDLTDL